MIFSKDIKRVLLKGSPDLNTYHMFLFIKSWFPQSYISFVSRRMASIYNRQIFKEEIIHHSELENHDFFYHSTLCIFAKENCQIALAYFFLMGYVTWLIYQIWTNLVSLPLCHNTISCKVHVRVVWVTIGQITFIDLSPFSSVWRDQIFCAPSGKIPQFL